MDADSSSKRETTRSKGAGKIASASAAAVAGGITSFMEMPNTVPQTLSQELLADKNPSRGYNRFWMDPGSTYARVKGEFRSSWITFPDNGRIPYTDAGISANIRAL